MAIEGCRECGALNSSLRIYEFYDGFRAVLCDADLRRIARDKWAGQINENEPVYQVVPQTNADFLNELADELVRRGDQRGADRARHQAARFKRETDKALKEIGEYPPRDNGPPAAPPFISF